MKKLILITGPTGSGKSTLEKNLQELFPESYKKVVSCTTRDMREGEINGIHYHFLSNEEFENSELIERVYFGGNGYGVPASEMDTDKDIILVVEPYGAKQIEEYVALHMQDRKLLKIFLDIPKSVCQENIRKSTPPEEAEKRIAREDPIKDDWIALGLQEDLRIKKLEPNLHIKVQEWILFND